MLNAMEQSETLSTGTLTSVDRALSLLELLAENGELSVTELARRLDTGKATAFRLARTLVNRGWVVKDPDLRYRLGPGVLALAAGAQASLDLRAALRVILEQLQEATGETIHLTKLDGREVIYIDQLTSPKPVLSVATLGGRSPAHCVSPGLAQLAALPQDRLDWFLSQPLDGYTEASITDPTRLREELVRVKRRGYAVNIGGFRPDVGGVGSAVTDPRGYPVVGLSVCVPVYRLRTLDLRRLGALVREAADDAHRKLWGTP